ncbi:hypothetical protein [Runella sp. SP2]|uniref:hypothetical protein n=1 Tax=Runella sp. SP2 TaxID=2268026 RepID=UPI000F08B4EE|nr:hypothetical protein [Runella sp. SP2]AYQ31433.1 hypothetical protein DTQ70_04215 [Runella sp. SP2]
MNLSKLQQSEEFLALRRAAQDENYPIPSHLELTALVVSAALEILSDRKCRYWEDHKIIKRIADSSYGEQMSTTKIRHCVQIAKMLTVYLNPLNVELEKIRLIHSIKDNAQKAATANTVKDRDVMAREHSNLIKIIGVDKPTDSGGGSTLVINIFNFDPTLIGAQKRPNLLADIALELKKIDAEQQEQIEDFEVLKKELEDDEYGVE